MKRITIAHVAAHALARAVTTPQSENCATDIPFVALIVKHKSIPVFHNIKSNNDIREST